MREMSALKALSARVGGDPLLVQAAGGKVLMPKTPIGQHGAIAHVLDSEGNRIGLHSQK